MNSIIVDCAGAPTHITGRAVFRIQGSRLAEGRKPEDVHALLKQITKAVVECAMQAGMTQHLGYKRHDPAGNNSGNSRNGVMRKTLKGDFGERVRIGSAMRVGIVQTFIDYHRRGIPQGGPLQPGIGPLIAALLPDRLGTVE